MVSIKSTKRAELLEAGGFQAVFYYSLRNLTFTDKFDESKFKNCDLIALKGYKGDDVNQADVKKEIIQPTVKGMGLENNIYRYIGVLLASDDKSDLMNKFAKLSLKSKFATSLFFPQYKKELIKYLQNQTDDFSKTLDIFVNKPSLTKDEEQIISNFSLYGIQEIIDYVLFEEIYGKFNRITFTNLSALEIIKQILGNFQDSIKKITTERRKGKTSFVFEDEYDVQDITYLLLKGIFYDLQNENPFMKKAGFNSIIDLMSEKEKIAIEVKMMLPKYTEKKVLEQLKIDIVNYSSWKELKNLVVFVYDPGGKKISDKNNFYSLNGEHSHNGVKFNVDVVVSN